jgi:hypothetical protein
MSTRTATVTPLTARPAPGTRVVYRRAGGIHSGVVEPYEPVSGVTFPVREDNSALSTMLLPSECALEAEVRALLRSGALNSMAELRF